jgi:hypothetical protein
LLLLCCLILYVFAGIRILFGKGSLVADTIEQVDLLLLDALDEIGNAWSLA